MRLSVLAIAVLAVLSIIVPASAQSVGIYVGPPSYVYDDDYIIEQPYVSVLEWCLLRRCS
jgi:hypothetical protein